MTPKQLSIHEIVKHAVEKGNAVLEWPWAIDRYDEFPKEIRGELARCCTLLLRSFGTGVGIPAGLAEAGVRA